MILAAINSRVGTLIPPTSVKSAISAATTVASAPSLDTTDFVYTADYSAALPTSTTFSSSEKKFLSNDPNEARIMVAAALALLSGLIQLAMAILHFGYVTVYLSDSIVQGFTTGCAIHIITSQIPTLLGIKIPTVQGQSKVIKVKHEKCIFVCILSLY